MIHKINTDNIPSTTDTTNITRAFNAPISSVEAWQNDPTVNASQISLRSYISGREKGDPFTEAAKERFAFASWNVRGCTNSEKRNQVNDVLLKQHIQIAAIQETRMPSGTMMTDNYIWYNVNNDENTRQREGGGTAIVVHKDIHCNNNFRKISSNSASYLCDVLGQKVLFIATYVRPVTNERNGEFATLIQYSLSLPTELQSKIVRRTIQFIYFFSVCNKWEYIKVIDLFLLFYFCFVRLQYIHYRRF